MVDWLVTNPLVWVALGLAFFGVFHRVSRWMGEVDANKTAFKEFMDRVDGRLSKIDGNIREIFGRLSPHQSVETKSPVQLTQYGKDISAYLDVKSWANEQVARLLPKTASIPDDDTLEYRIFTICQAYVREAFETNANMKTNIEAAAYNRGTDTIQIIKVYEVELRDAVLANIK